MGRQYYNYAGLRIASEIVVPEWSPFEDDVANGNPDVVISLGDALPMGSPVKKHRLIASNEYRLGVPEVGCFRVTGGREIVIDPVREVTPARLRHWLIGSVWGALCYQRGIFLIHASAVMVGEEAVLFCARARGGKSTLAARLSACGHALVSDDLCRLDVPDDRMPVVYPSAPRLKLWRDALEALGSSIDQTEPDQYRSAKFHLVSSAKTQLRPASVRGIYLLDWGDFGIHPLSGIEAFQGFMATSIYRPGLLMSTGQLGYYSRRALTVLQRVPLWALRRPREFAGLGATVELLGSHWSGII